MGIELRRIREAQGLTLDTAGDLLGRSGSSLSKIENGLIRLWPRELEQILDRYAIHDRAIRTWLIALSIEGRKKGWWKQYKDVIDPKFLDYVSLEAEATHISTYEPSVVPGLLQNEEYTREVITAVPIRAGGDNIQPYVDIRMDRQRLLTRPDPPHLHAILGETVLRQQIGGPQVMASQLELLIDLMAVGSITLQVVPFSAGAHAGVDGSFTVLDVKPGLPVAVVDHPLGSVYSDQESDVRRCTLRFDRLRASAFSEEDSRRLIEQVIAEL